MQVVLRLTYYRDEPSALERAVGCTLLALFWLLFWILMIRWIIGI